jgi:predicted component of type VI protein secretion system
MGSSNGTRIDGKRLRPNEPQALKTDQQIRFGELQMRLSLLRRENLAQSA